MFAVPTLGGASPSRPTPDAPSRGFRQDRRAPTGRPATATISRDRDRPSCPPKRLIRGLRGPEQGARAGCRRRRIRAKIRAGIGARPHLRCNRRAPGLALPTPCPRQGLELGPMLATKRSAVCLLVVGLLLWGGAATRLLAQAPGAAASADPAEPQEIPRRVAIRFLTDSDYPPFNYYDEDNVLTGFNVDIARAVCLELAAACDIQVRPWPELLAALQKGETDAVIASHVISTNALKVVDFTDSYYYTYARFSGKRRAGRIDVTTEVLAGMETDID